MIGFLLADDFRGPERLAYGVDHIHADGETLGQRGNLRYESDGLG